MNEEILIYCCTQFVKKLIQELRNKTISDEFFIIHTNVKIDFLLHHVDRIPDPLRQKKIKALIEEYNKIVSKIDTAKS